MGQEASMPANGEAFQDTPNEFYPPTMEEQRGGPPPESQQQHRHGPKALVARAFHNKNQSHGMSDAARVAAENGHYEYTYPTTPPSFGPAGEQQQQQPQMMTPEQQQYYHQQQLLHQQQQQQQQQYYQQQQQQHAAAGHPQHLQQQQQPVVGVMYAEGGRNSSSKRALKTAATAARSSGRSLINSMRNLSIKAAPGLKTTGLGKKDQETDWETRWDEDDESEGDDDEEEEVNFSAATSPYVNQPLRPGMDGGHSTSPVKRPNELSLADRLSSSPARLQQQRSPPQQQPVLPPELVPTREEDVLTKRADMALQQGDNAVQWDMLNEAGATEDVYEKPNVQMFLPLLRVLGKGSFGKVVLVQKRVGKEKGILFAMKILRKSHLVKRRQIERTKTERKVLSVVDHPFIMKLHFAFQTEDKLYLVLDYCPGGELFFHLSRFRRFPERVARFYAAELLLAIGHLHKRGIIYRDLKPENVLLDAEGHVKLGDFGLAKDKIKNPCEGATSMCGTPEYMAPEVLAQSGHGFCVDYWGLGMLVYEMMTGLPPWYTTDRAKLFRRLKSAPLEIPSYFSPHAAGHVSALLERNPRRRLGVTGVRAAMEHEFFRSINWRALYARRVEAPIRPCEGWKSPNGNNNSNRNGPHSFDNAGGGTENMSNEFIDAACANFDNTFTRMPVDTEDSANEEEQEELRDDTFLGFTFDNLDNEALPAFQARHRSTKHLD